MRSNSTFHCLLLVALCLGIGLFGLGCGASGGGKAAGSVNMLTDVHQSAWNTDDAGASGLLLETKHYRIYTTCNSKELVDCMPGFMEAAHANHLRLTGLAEEPAEPMPIYLMGNRQQWAALTATIVPPQQLETYLSIQAGGYCFKKVCVFWDIGGLGTLSTASHEGLHQFLAWRLKDQLPMWLEEGLCTQAEGYQIFGQDVTFTPNQNVLRHGDLRSAIIEGHWIPLEKLLPMDAGDAVTKMPAEAVGYYGQLWSLALLIRTNPVYRQGLERMMRDAQDGKLAATLGVPREALEQLRRMGRPYNRTISRQLFEQYISKDLAGFESQYKAFSRQAVGLKP